MSDARARMNKADKAKADELLRSGLTISEVADRLGKHQCAIHEYTRSSEYNPRRKVRRCLACGKEFMSEHAGNRLCGNHDDGMTVFDTPAMARLA